MFGTACGPPTRLVYFLSFFFFFTPFFRFELFLDYIILLYILSHCLYIYNIVYTYIYIVMKSFGHCTATCCSFCRSHSAQRHDVIQTRNAGPENNIVYLPIIPIDNNVQVKEITLIKYYTCMCSEHAFY